MKRRTFIKIAIASAALPGLARAKLGELPQLPKTERGVSRIEQMTGQWEIELFGEWHAFDVEPNEDGELRSVTELRMYATQTGRLPDALWFRGPNGEHGQASFEWTSQNAVLGDTIAIEPGAVSITAV